VPSSVRLRPALLLLLPPLALGGWLAWRHWQGPELPGYRLELRPLVQRVVASGEVSSQSLAQIGSELTGVVKARHVREGDAVHPGDLLIELVDDEQQARLREAEAALRQLIESDRPQAQAALREAESRLTQASRERERREALFERQLLATEATRLVCTARCASSLARNWASAASLRLATRPKKSSSQLAMARPAV